ncbi:pyridoxamine 5'-phosphate oxidase family protein [Paramagnetospirillum magneticum]|uniref:Predicted flavin-nucleotide-binding protein structurally n=1 Tax=Paramagnetospirillum magneticum (strain ATCC 700264 / AMB-1) TaxID=342108 RepID=Q2W7U8_PARM1|nr:pyridoxamine 5'-phosphate oxidase family protein [Paramagnetospirillum magneticum]BAE50077.1 Predicted flavin-nucleotide-binding protein structurally [Paramagnetospirillum magneticum AMB-1]
MMELSPFHAGEREAQRRAGFGQVSAPIRDFMPDQHRAFFSLLPFLPLASVDEDGFPVATVLTGPPGFISSPDPTTLAILSPPPSDGTCALVEGVPVGILGIDLATRRRNRANGRIVSVNPSGFAVAVEQSFATARNTSRPVTLSRPRRRRPASSNA